MQVYKDAHRVEKTYIQVHSYKSTSTLREYFYHFSHFSLALHNRLTNMCFTLGDNVKFKCGEGFRGLTLFVLVCPRFCIYV
ncbi:hypothetical protein HanRHA438_Chr06g0271971 [Helianthus annuus]|nr:hypothetical protein HanRHA438_Chr06g0271971 [Helianthus annuus]